VIKVEALPLGCSVAGEEESDSDIEIETEPDSSSDSESYRRSATPSTSSGERPRRMDAFLDIPQGPPLMKNRSKRHVCSSN
jgi:hypothetical protein